MKKFLFPVLLLLLCTIGAYAQIIDRPVATVSLAKREVITQRQLKQQITTLEKELRTSVTQANRKEVLDVMINGLIVNQAADRDGIKITDFEANTFINQQYRSPLEQSAGRQVTDAELKTYIQQTGLSWDDFYKGIKEGLLHQRYITEKKRDFFARLSGPTEKEILDVYEMNSLSYTNPEIVRFSHVYVDTRRMSADEKRRVRSDMDALFRDVQNGKKSFNDVLVSYADRPVPNYKSEITAFLARNDNEKIQLLGAPFYETVFGMRNGDVKGVIESNVGFHIIKMSEKIPKRFLSLDDPILPGQTLTVREYIRQQKVLEIQQKALQQATADLVKELREKADIKIFEENLNW